MKLSRRTAAALLALTLLLSLAGCSDSDVRKAAKAADSISLGLQTTQAANESLYKSGLLDKEEARGVALAVRDATLANEIFIAKVRTLKDTDPSNKAVLLQWVKELEQAVEQAYQQGILRVKNPDSRAKLEVAFAGVRAGVQIIQGIIGGQP